MSFKIEHSDDVSVVTPILRVLREAIAPADFEARLSSALQNGYQVLVARGIEDVQGCLGYRYTHDVCWGKTLYVDDLVVRPEAQVSGIGAALLDAVKAQAHANACDHIRLCSGVSRVDAHRFYEQNGFNRSSVQFVFAL